jgi:hypothetical protein
MKMSFNDLPYRGEPLEPGEPVVISGDVVESGMDGEFISYDDNHNCIVKLATGQTKTFAYMQVFAPEEIYGDEDDDDFE